VRQRRVSQTLFEHLPPAPPLYADRRHRRARRDGAGSARRSPVAALRL